MQRLDSMSPPLYRTLWLALIAFALLLPSASQAALVAYWNFDEASGTNVLDTAGNPTRTNDGYFAFGTQAPDRIAGRLGGGVGFAWTTGPSAGGKRIGVPYHTNLSLNGPFTISFWYRMDAAAPASTFPGIMRLGTNAQSATSGA